MYNQPVQFTKVLFYGVWVVQREKLAIEHLSLASDPGRKAFSSRHSCCRAALLVRPFVSFSPPTTSHRAQKYIRASLSPPASRDTVAAYTPQQHRFSHFQAHSDRQEPAALTRFSRLTAQLAGSLPCPTQARKRLRAFPTLGKTYVSLESCYPARPYST